MNLRKVGGYTYQALLGLAATQLGVPVSNLTVTDGIVSGGEKTISYGQLVQGQHLELKIPVEGKRTKVDPSNFTGVVGLDGFTVRSEEHTSELQSHLNLVCRLLLEKKKKRSSRELSRSII